MHHNSGSNVCKQYYHKCRRQYSSEGPPNTDGFQEEGQKPAHLASPKNVDN